MSDNTINQARWSFWVIAAFALIWNLMGGMNFIMQMNADAVASFPETHRAIIEGRPLWATGGFAVSVFGGALGGLLLLLRKSAANIPFALSLIGTMVTMIHTSIVTKGPVEFSAVEIFIIMVLPLIVAGFMIWYTNWASTKGWIN